MQHRKKSSRPSFLIFITSENIQEHGAEIEEALQLPANNIAVLFSDDYVIEYKNRLDQSLADSVNVIKKFVQNATRFHGESNQEIELYLAKMNKDIEESANHIISSLRQKYGQLMRDYENKVRDARDQIRNTKGYNEAILLYELKKNIIEVMQNSSFISEPHALDACQNYHLQAFHKKLTTIIKSAKHHKKQLVHDIKHQIGKLVNGQKLLFCDKHDVNFTLAAYDMDNIAVHAQNNAKEVLAQLKSASETSIREFENTFFRQDCFQKISRSYSESMVGLQSVREESRARLKM